MHIFHIQILLRGTQIWPNLEGWHKSQNLPPPPPLMIAEWELNMLSRDINITVMYPAKDVQPACLEAVILI